MPDQDLARDPPGPPVQRARGPGPALMGADTLMGNEVFNRDGEDLGDIRELMIEVATGRIAYAVLSFGGFMGMGDKLFAVPWAALSLDTAEKRFTLGVSRDRLEQAPGFDKSAWPSMVDEEWVRGVHAFYGTSGEGRDAAWSSAMPATRKEDA